MSCEAKQNANARRHILLGILGLIAALLALLAQLG
jgi:hypothetical protein